MFKGVSLDQAPPFEAPLKFFITAPIMGMIASLVMLFLSENLIALHIVTIGFMVMMMFGAMLQMLPVVAGVVLQKPRIIANFTYIFLLISLFAFAISFYFHTQIAFVVLFGAIVFGMGIFSFISAKELLKVQNKSMIVQGMILSFVFFILAFGLGLLMIYFHITSLIPEFYPHLVSLHFHIIFFGWVFLLISSISFQVVPMFWVCDAYKINEQKIIVWSVILGVVTLFLSSILSKFFFAFGGFYYIYLTYQKLKNRKRKLKDQTVLFWQMGLFFFAFGLVSFLLVEFFPFDETIIALLFGGFALAIINGMMYKIIPFLTWFHLSNRGIFPIPTMRDMLDDRFVTVQRILFFLSIIASLVDLSLGALFFLSSNIVLFYNILVPARIYFRLKATIN